MEVAKRTNGPTDLSGQRYLVDIIPLGGGLPINVGNDTIGAIGISGSPTRRRREVRERRARLGRSSLK